MANYTCIHGGPAGGGSMLSILYVIVEAPVSPDHLYLLLAKPGMAWGRWNVCAREQLWHLALVIFVTKGPPAYEVGQDCHNLD